ncbi:hypothetical protein KGP24_23330 (plasmid) [Enterobacter sp. JBIWA008]|uniref:hypothetical protein n=1 Tax=Enterobacter sp. JBIWA008 TaxID=2831892 RepID=UPI001CBAF1D5|nr:hypothetical protein [Enterobacter sp. JBIWA008]UAN43334.1 hypothetical protein KGP24_23330 [Enterobacter sp. JBIWA008]
MNKLQQSLMIMTLLTASLSATAAGILTGTQQTVTRNLIVAGTAEASVSITPAGNILAGNYTGNQQMAVWSAKTTGGTIAYRLNPTIVQMFPTPSYSGGYIKNNANATQRIEILLISSCINQGTITSNAAPLSGQWRVCPEGSEAVSGTIVTATGKLQTLIGGTYPVAIDAVAWTF